MLRPLIFFLQRTLRVIKNDLGKLGFNLGLNLKIKTDFIYFNYIKKIRHIFYMTRGTDLPKPSVNE